MFTKSSAQRISIILIIFMVISVVVIPVSSENSKVYAKDAVYKGYVGDIFFTTPTLTGGKPMAHNKVYFYAAGLFGYLDIGHYNGELKYRPMAYLNNNGKITNFENEYFELEDDVYWKGWYKLKKGNNTLTVYYDEYVWDSYSYRWLATGDVYYDKYIVTSKEKKEVVKFNVNKGKKLSKAKSKKTVIVGKKYGKLPKVTRKGYTFKGWYTKKKGGSKVTKNTIMLAKKPTLYAHWKKKKK